MYVPTALSGLLHWKVCIPVLTAQGLLRTQNFAGRAHFYWQRHVVRHKSCLVTIWKSSMAWDKTLTFQGEWILSPFPLEPGWKALQQNVRDLQRGSLKGWHDHCSCSTRKTLPVFLLQGDSMKRRKKPILCHTPMYVTNWINSHMSASISNPPWKAKVHFQKETAVCSHIPEKSACHTPPSPVTTKATSQEKKAG